MKFNVGLAEGTNWLTLWVTNSAGLSSETNMAVVKNDMTLALTSIDGDLWQATVNVSGVISPYSGYCVWVNGVKGTNNGDGSWSANNVPVSAGGVASFDMSASSGGGDPDSNTNMDNPPEIVTAEAEPKNFDLWLRYAEAHGDHCGNTQSAEKIIERMDRSGHFKKAQMRKANNQLKKWRKNHPTEMSGW
jgi:hypothetical protein